MSFYVNFLWVLFCIPWVHKLMLNNGNHILFFCHCVCYYRQLSHGYSFSWPLKMQENEGRRVDNCRKGNTEHIRRIRKYLSRQSAISLIHAFITSKLDYCNSLLYGPPTIHINKLQRVQNAPARLVTNTPRICHITPILEDLHWLPIKYRIQFKIVLLTFKCLYGLAPQYLVDLIAVAPQSRYNLRSRNATLLVSANARCLPTLGDRAFQSAAPKLWNSLPAEIRNTQTLTSFKRALKTHFFKTAFN